MEASIDSVLTAHVYFFMSPVIDLHIDTTYTVHTNPNTMNQTPWVAFRLNKLKICNVWLPCLEC